MILAKTIPGEKLRGLLYQNGMEMEAVNLHIERETLEDVGLWGRGAPKQQHYNLMTWDLAMNTSLRSSQENKEMLKGGWMTEEGMAQLPGWNEYRPQCISCLLSS